MVNLTKSVHVERPQQEVFEFLADPANDPSWRDSAISAEWMTEGPVAIGSRLKSVDKFMGREIESTSEVTAYDPPNEYGQKSIGGPISFEFKMRLEPDGSGTKVTMAATAEVGGFFKLAEGLVRKQFEKQIASDFEGLKRALEGSQA